ncbi:putative pentatricopeptide repeat-containing protein At1g12700, mitochondrial isoform X3 [Jatropha curcas]|uniref:putative pentatricopeptide repeat-containing protein At1g12700, mitochondrial isoform X3 n=1 Tax=Jatropha curcas TaxID=180498 RepID=UPI001894D081|nr:putative pentatricopeptide repeat-containing protein At1g12700, mitochondrial isoform X3 [Jatropha curcas]
MPYYFSGSSANGEDKFDEAVDLFDDIVEKGYQPNVYTYNVIVNGLCKIGKTTVAFDILKRMVEKGCLPNVVSFNAIIDSLCKDRFVTKALDLFFKIKSKGRNKA